MHTQVETNFHQDAHASPVVLYRSVTVVLSCHGEPTSFEFMGGPVTQYGGVGSGFMFPSEGFHRVVLPKNNENGYADFEVHYM